METREVQRIAILRKAKGRKGTKYNFKKFFSLKFKFRRRIT